MAPNDFTTESFAMTLKTLKRIIFWTVAAVAFFVGGYTALLSAQADLQKEMIFTARVSEKNRIMNVRMMCEIYVLRDFMMYGDKPTDKYHCEKLHPIDLDAGITKPWTSLSLAPA